MKLTAVFIILLSVSLHSQDVRNPDILSAKLAIQSNISNSASTGYSIKILPEGEKKKAGLAILYSFLLPGMGEIYAGNYSLGKYFTIADGVLWGALTGMSYYGAWQRDNYKSFAHTHGGVNPDGKDDQYFATIGGYQNVDKYNREHELYREFDKIYDTGTHFWRWESPSDRKEYRTMWIASENAFNNIRFVVGALILNRVVSVINAVRLVSRHNKNLSTEVSWNVSAGMQMMPGSSHQFQLNFYGNF